MLALPPIPIIRRSAPPPADGSRADGRTVDQLRPLKLRTGVVTSASGSAMLELAHTKVLCSVFGPHATDGRDFSEQGQLECSVRFASFARRGRERQNPAGSPEEKTLSLALSSALSASVQLHLLPKSTIAVHALVLQDDGGALAAAISCASLALADASIELYDLVAACGCALLPANPPPPANPPAATKALARADTPSGDARLALDCASAELAAAGGTLTVACMPALDQLTLVRQEGCTTHEVVSSAMQLALSGCRLLHRQMTAALAVGGEPAADAPAADKGKAAHEEDEAAPRPTKKSRARK